MGHPSKPKVRLCSHANKKAAFSAAFFNPRGRQCVVADEAGLVPIGGAVGGLAEAPVAPAAFGGAATPDCAL